MCEKTADRSTQPWQVEPEGLKDKGIFKRSYKHKGRTPSQRAIYSVGVTELPGSWQ